jgi:hypothetical protein
MLLVWVALAQADDLLARKVRLDIPAAPLSSALIRFSTQTGVQVAAADQGVLHLQSQALKGDYTVEEALSLLLDRTGLSFSTVGSSTIVIRSAASVSSPALQVAAADAGASRGPKADNTVEDALNLLLHHTGLSFSHTDSATMVVPRTASPPPPSDTPLAADSVARGSQGRPVPGAAQASSEPPDVSTITTALPPSARELAGDSLFQFVVHHATRHQSVSTLGGPIRWRGGRPETVCPLTIGLGQAYNDFVSARIRAVAAQVGAPVQTDARCEPNVAVIFTSNPRLPMETIVKRAVRWPGVGFPRPIEEELQISGRHAIQGWYMIAGGGWSILNRDASQLGGLELRALWPRVIPTSISNIDGNSGILAVALVVDTSKLAGSSIGSIADYLAMAALTIVQSPDHCDPLPSILDLLSSTCGARVPPESLTAADVAFLKALYHLNTALRNPRMSDIVNNMREQLTSKP